MSFLRASALLLLAAVAVWAADPPAPVVALFRSAAEELAAPDADGFFDHFDPATPGFAQLKNDVISLLTIAYVTSTIEFVSDEGDDQHRDLEIDWLWRQGGAPHRMIIKCRVERKGKTWKITRWEPVGFFKPDPLR